MKFITIPNKCNDESLKILFQSFLLGNVAHDLKTPLFAIEADVNMLKLLLGAIPAAILHSATTTLCRQRGCDESDIDPAALFESLFSTFRSVFLPFILNLTSNQLTTVALSLSNPNSNPNEILIDS